MRTCEKDRKLLFTINSALADFVRALDFYFFLAEVMNTNHNLNLLFNYFGYLLTSIVKNNEILLLRSKKVSHKGLERHEGVF